MNTAASAYAIINCNTAPSCMDPNSICGCSHCRLKIVSHQKLGELAWDPSRIEFYYSANQLDRTWKPATMNNKLHAEVVNNHTPLNACVLDYLLRHKELIPLSFHEKIVLFHGTLYCHRQHGLCIRALHSHYVADEFSAVDGYGGIQHEERLLLLKDFTTGTVVSSAILRR